MVTHAILGLDDNFEYKSDNEQFEIVDSLQAYARSAGLAGTVVPVWLHGRQMKFIAPRPWHPFFKSLTWNSVLQNLNKELTCS